MEERFKTFTVLIAKISRNIRRIKTEEMSEMNLKSPHFSCLYYLYKAGPLTAKELSDVCEEDKSAISRSIEHLEKQGYLQCDSQAKKRYRAHLSLTEKGEKVGQFIANKIDSILELASAGLTDENRKIFYQSLTLVSDNLQKICNEYRE